MLMEKLGYLISELPPLIFVAWFAVRFFQFRRRQKNQPSFSEQDRRLLFGTVKQQSGGMLYIKLLLAVVAVALVGLLEILVLAPLGAAILTGVLILTSTSIVRRVLAVEE